MKKFESVTTKHKNKKVYDCYSDGGHAWLKVTRTELVRLKIIDKISFHSYQNNGSVFLEEDCDAGIFIEAKKAIDGIKIDFREHYSEYSKIRRYPFFTCDLIDNCLQEIVNTHI